MMLLQNMQVLLLGLATLAVQQPLTGHLKLLPGIEHHAPILVAGVEGFVEP